MEIPVPAVIGLLSLIVGLLTWQQNRLWKLQDQQKDAMEKWMKSQSDATEKRLDKFEKHVDDRFSSITMQVNHISLQIATTQAMTRNQGPNQA